MIRLQKSVSPLRSGLVLGLALAGVFTSACREFDGDVSGPIAAYVDRNQISAQSSPQEERPPTRDPSGTPPRPVATPRDRSSGLPERESHLVAPGEAEPLPLEDVLYQIPDPSVAVETFERRLGVLRQTMRPDDIVIINYSSVVNKAREYLQQVRRNEQFMLSLSECIRRTLEHNYVIRIESLNPAISRTFLVEAEAAFDAEFFFDLTKDKRDNGVFDNHLFEGRSDSLQMEGGFRKLLPTGMQVSTSLVGSRLDAYPRQKDPFNPAYSSSFVTQFRQPLLRGFGLDVNRAQIVLRQLDLAISEQQFKGQVRDTLLNVEAAYWRLAQARRAAAILAESVAQNFVTYRAYKARERHNATPAQVANAEARWLAREVDFREAVKNVQDAEDVLKNLLNDPDLLLSRDIEIIPTETPFIAPLAVDQFAEVRTALENSTAINEARLRIRQAGVNTSVAKNQTLPQLDLTFQYEVQGVADTFDTAFDRVTSNRWVSYTVGLNFSYPIGNRGPEAALRRARLQETQAVTVLQQVMDNVVLGVNNAVRALLTRYSQIPASYQSAVAEATNLFSLQARAPSIDPTYLETELGSVERLANTRQLLLQVVTEYNIAIVELERAKGNLLRYNNVNITYERGR